MGAAALITGSKGTPLESLVSCEPASPSEGQMVGPPMQWLQADDSIVNQGSPELIQAMQEATHSTRELSPTSQGPDHKLREGRSHFSPGPLLGSLIEYISGWMNDWMRR